MAYLHVNFDSGNDEQVMLTTNLTFPSSDLSRELMLSVKISAKLIDVDRKASRTKIKRLSSISSIGEPVTFSSSTRKVSCRSCTRHLESDMFSPCLRNTERVSTCRRTCLIRLV